LSDWNVYTCSVGAAILLISDTAKLSWTFAVVNTVLHYCIRLCLGHRGALPLSGGAFALLALPAFVSLLCLGLTPLGPMQHSLWSAVRSAVQEMCARLGFRWHCYDIDSTTAQRQPLHSRSLSNAVSGEIFVTDADTASTPGICITADGSTAPHQAFHHAAGFSDSSQMPKAPVSGSNEATGSSLHDAGHAVMHGTSSLTHSNATSTEAEHPKLVCFGLGKHRRSKIAQDKHLIACWDWCVSLLSHCSKQHGSKYVHVLPSLALLYPELGLSDE